MFGILFGIIFIIIGVVLLQKNDKVSGGIVIALGVIFMLFGFMTASAGFGGGRRRH
jgi:hypothetical protein